MLLRIDDTLINTDLVTHVTYKREPTPFDERDNYPAQPQGIVIYFAGGKTQSYSGALADTVWDELSRDLKVVTSP